MISTLYANRKNTSMIKEYVRKKDTYVINDIFRKHSLNGLTLSTNKMHYIIKQSLYTIFLIYVHIRICIPKNLLA